MIIEAYTPDMFDHLIEMHKTRKHTLADILKPDDIPGIGFIVHRNKQGIAAGFLRLVECKYAQIDTLVTNIKFSSADRAEAMDMLVNELIDTAKDLKLKGLLFLTDETSIIERASKIGFTHVNQHVMSMNMTIYHS